MKNWMLILTLSCLLVTGFACTTTNPSGGGDTTDPLDVYQLGEDADFDTDIAAIATAINGAYECAGTETSLTDQNVLDALKGHYTGEADGFPAYVAETVTLDQTIEATVCNTELGDDAELDDVVADITIAVNQGLECQGEAAEETDEESLLAVKRTYLQNPSGFETLLDAADFLLEQAEAAVTEFCGS